MLFISWFDSDFDGRLSFEEFSEAFLPIKDEYRSLVKVNPPEFIRNLPYGKYYKLELKDYFCDETIKLLMSSLKNMIINE